MLSEEFVSATCGPPLSSNTSIAKHVGIYTHTLSPAFTVSSTFKNSSAPVNCLAVSETHVFAAQQEKAYVHVYSRLRGNQEAFVSFPERISCLALAADVLIVGTAEGRLMLWEICTGRLVSTPARHVQAVTCVATTPWHILSGSEDADVHVWSLARLLDLDAAGADHEPDRSLTQHRGSITALVASSGTNPHSSALCVSASKDKSCIIWNYHSGHVLRTLLFPSLPLCLSLDPATRALFVSTDDGSLFLVEFFASNNPLLGPYAEDAATVVQVSSPFGIAPPDTGPASCLGTIYDGTMLLTGHPRGQILKWDVAGNRTPTELANVNAAVTNLVCIPPLSAEKSTKVTTVVKPSQAERNYTLTMQLDGALRSDSAAATTTRFDSLLDSVGFPQDVLESAVLATTTTQQPTVAENASEGDSELQRQNEELWGIINEQRALQKQTLQRYLESRP